MGECDCWNTRLFKQSCAHQPEGDDSIHTHRYAGNEDVGQEDKKVEDAGVYLKGKLSVKVRLSVHRWCPKWCLINYPGCFDLLLVRIVAVMMLSIIVTVIVETIEEFPSLYPNQVQFVQSLCVCVWGVWCWFGWQRPEKKWWRRWWWSVLKTQDVLFLCINACTRVCVATIISKEPHDDKQKSSKNVLHFALFCQWRCWYIESMPKIVETLENRSSIHFLIIVWSFSSSSSSEEEESLWAEKICWPATDRRKTGWILFLDPKVLLEGKLTKIKGTCVY